MRATYQLMNVEDMQAALTVTMSVKDWQQIADKLPESWPHWQFSAKINEMIRHANARYCESQESK